MKKISSGLYDIAKGIGRVASHVNDIETILTGDPKKIVKRIHNKTVSKTVFKTVNKLAKIFKIK